MTFQERNAEGPPVGEPPMSGRVLSEEEVAEIEGRARNAYFASFVDMFRLITSHRLLAEMVKQYERKDYGE